MAILLVNCPQFIIAQLGVWKAGAIAALLTTGAVWSILFYQDIIAAKPPGAEEGELLIGGMMPVTLMFAVSAVTLVTVSLLTKPPAQSTVEKFFIPDAR